MTQTKMILLLRTICRRGVGSWTIRRVIQTVVIGLTLIQLSLYLLALPSQTYTDRDRDDAPPQVEEISLVKRMTDSLWQRKVDYLKMRRGDRSINSIKDYLDKTNRDNKIRLDKEGTLKSKKSDDENLYFKRKPNLSNSSSHFDNLPICPRHPPNLLGRLFFQFDDTPPTMKEIAINNPSLQKGGFYHPPYCVARSKVAFIIPHRAREMHLRALLWHLHPIFQRQQLYYRIYVVQQAGELAFNKAKLMNIGFTEAMNEDDYDCVVFHDVDLLPEDDRLLYTCKATPKHLSVAIDKYGYRLPYSALFGGVTMLSIEQFRDVNGYSNKYWGWGGEDDDMFNRIFSKGYTIKRPPFHLARYKMSFHHRDKGNRLNLMRYEILSNSVHRMQDDGLNNVRYTIHSVDRNPIYTNITANVGTAVVNCKSYLSDWTCRMVMWLCEHFTFSCGLLQYNSTDDGTLQMPLDSWS